MLAAISKILTEHGFGALLWLTAIATIAWALRVSLKNPLEVVSGALDDVEKARKALREEIEHRDVVIGELRGKVKDLREKVAELEAEIDAK